MGSLVLNEAALKFLLEDPDGPVGQDLRRRSENITIIYHENVARYLPTFVEQGGRIDYEIVSDDDGLRSFIGINPGHGSDRFAENVAKKVLKEPDKAIDAMEGLYR